jgi:hypothetical protein
MKTIKLFAAVLAAFISGNISAQTITASDVTIEPGKTADVTFTININEETETKAALAEFKMTLPEGITVKYDADEEDYVYEKGAAMTIKSHNVSIQKTASGAFYVLVKNESGKEFKAASGDYLTVTLEAAANIASGEYTADMKEIGLFALNSSQMNTVKEGSFKITVPTSTAINGISLDDPNAEVYTVGGQRVKNANLKKGVYVVNGKKVTVK